MYSIHHFSPLRKVGSMKLQFEPCRSQIIRPHHKTNHSYQRCLSVMNRFKNNDQRFHEEPNNSKRGSRTWLYVGIPFGTLGVGYKLIKPDTENPQPASQSIVKFYRWLPLREMSRLWGKMNNINLPEWSRHTLLSIYANMFGCNIQEAAVEDLRHYKNLGEFFRRGLKPSARPIDPEYNMVMPSDGRILNFGTVDRNTGMIEQVKGIDYSVKSFLGPHSWLAYQFMLTDNLNETVSEDSKMTVKDEMMITMKASDKHLSNVTDQEYVRDILADKEDTTLYQIVIYLAPGDYHRFHSPAKFNIKHRRHFPGELLSVNPGIARRVPGLFSINERAVYYGQWKGGFLAMSPVGATNVGSITTYFDRELTTNNKITSKEHAAYSDKIFSRGLSLNKGDSFGEFNLGSTIVLIFEAPKDFRWAPNVKTGATVRMGEPLGDFREESAGQPAVSSRVFTQDGSQTDTENLEVELLKSEQTEAHFSKQSTSLLGNRTTIDKTSLITSRYSSSNQSDRSTLSNKNNVNLIANQTNSSTKPRNVTAVGSSSEP